MAITNFKTLHSAIKALIVAKGFRYVPLNKWYSLDLGVFPTALKNDCFTIKFPDLEESTFESEGWGLLTVSIEFVLDSQKELYLAKIDDCLTAIENLRTLTSSELVVRTETKQNFTSTDILDKVLLTFNDVKLDIRSVA